MVTVTGSSCLEDVTLFRGRVPGHGPYRGMSLMQQGLYETKDPAVGDTVNETHCTTRALHQIVMKQYLLMQLTY